MLVFVGLLLVFYFTYCVWSDEPSDIKEAWGDHDGGIGYVIASWFFGTILWPCVLVGAIAVSAAKRYNTWSMARKWEV